jgi:O-antigen/teichoic acid export membrane protein
VSETAAVALERRVLRRLASHPALPAFLRGPVRRLEGSSLGYRLAHGAFWSLVATALSRALALAASVLTARILGKAGFGEYGVLSSTILTFQAFSSLGLAMTATKYVAELRHVDRARTGRILGLSVVVSTGAGLLALGTLWALAPWLAARTIDAPQLAGPLRIAAIGLLFSTMQSAQQGALAGFEAFRSITWLNFWTGLIGVPVAVFGVWRFGLVGAVWALVVTAAVQWALTELAVRRRAAADGIVQDLRGWTREGAVLWRFSLPALAQGIMVSPVTWAATAILVNQPHGYLEMGALSAANQWYGAVMFLPTALGGAVLPVLSERIGQADPAGARRVLKAAVALNAAVVVPVVVAGILASPFLMRLYGPGFASAWPTMAVVLVTAAVVAVLNPVGSVLAASNRLWTGFLMNSGWAAVFLAATLAFVGAGALGVASARLLAYLVHAVWTVWFAARFVRGRAAA